MAKLIFDQHAIKQRTGLDTKNSLLYPHMDLESYVFSSPLLVEKNDGSSVLLVKDIERGNFNEQNLKCQVKYFRTYFTFDGDNRDIPDTWLELLKSTIDGEELTVDDSAYFSAWEELNKIVDVTMTESPPWWRVYLYEINYVNVLDEFRASYPDALADAKQLAKELCQEKEILSILDNGYQDSRFDLLDQLLKDNRVKTLVISSPQNGQEVSGIPFRFIESVPSIVVYDNRRIYLLTSKPVEQSFPSLKGVYQNLAQAFRSLPLTYAGTIGIEENNLPFKLYKELGLEQYKHKPVGAMLRDWREKRAGEELPYYMTAAAVTRFGIETALKKVQNDLNKGKTILETDVECTLYSSFQDFMTSRQISTRQKPYFTVLHTGNRSRRPNLPQFTKIDKDTRSLKIDCGILVIDNKGLVRAVSDIARTLPLDAPAKEVYGIVSKIMVDVTIPYAVPGRTGEEVYLAGLKDLKELEGKLVKLNMLPAGQQHPLDQYNRDIGHVMGKQEPANICFKLGNSLPLEDGMIGCVEYQWPYYPYTIGVEDMFLVSAKGSMNITR